MEKIEYLHSTYILGFTGKIVNGFHICRSNNYIIYPCANKIILQNISDNSQLGILQCESRDITATSLSPCETMISASYLPYPGFKAVICIWNINERKLVTKYESHRDKVHSIIFTEKYILSVGGFQDDNLVICYDLHKRCILFVANGKSNITGDSTKITTLFAAPFSFVIAGDNILRLWTITKNNETVYNDVQLSKTNRNILCLQVNGRNRLIYCGTHAGDVMKFSFTTGEPILTASTSQARYLGCFGKVTDRRASAGKRYETDKYELGVTALFILEDNTLLIGTGDGVIELVSEKWIPPKLSLKTDYSVLPNSVMPLFVKKRSLRLDSEITAIVRYKENEFFTSTKKNAIFKFNSPDFNIETIVNTLPDIVTGITFPWQCSEIFVTACKNIIQIRRFGSSRPALEIATAIKAECLSVTVSWNGSLILSSWSDGYIRGYTPESGKLLYQSSVFRASEAAVICVSAGGTVVLGSSNGEVVFLESARNNVSVVANKPEHRGRVLSMHVNNSGKLSASSAADGLIIIWDVRSMESVHKIFSYTVTKSVKFHPTLDELISCGNDRKIKFWNINSGSLVKQIHGSISSPINSVDISVDGKYIASVAQDNIVKIWSYKQYEIIKASYDNTLPIKSVHFSCDGKFIVSITERGCIIFFKFPLENKIIDGTLNNQEKS